MKKLIFMVVVLSFAVPAFATMSLGWWNEGAAGSTHQLWDFTPGYVAPSGSGYTAEPESVLNPIPNRVTATIVPVAGRWDEQTLITSPSAIFVTLEVPNYLKLNPYKEIWVDIGNNVVNPLDISISATPTDILFEYAILPGQGDAELEEAISARAK
jgi:hypothetical protein